jgi:hypothetical protein
VRQLDIVQLTVNDEAFSAGPSRVMKVLLLSENLNPAERQFDGVIAGSGFDPLLESTCVQVVQTARLASTQAKCTIRRGELRRSLHRAAVFGFCAFGIARFAARAIGFAQVIRRPRAGIQNGVQGRSARE